MNTTIMADTPRDAMTAGEDGYLSIPGPYYQPGPFTVFPRGAEPMQYLAARDGHEGGLHFSAVEAATLITSGGTESAIHPPSAVVATLEVQGRPSTLATAEDGLRAALVADAVIASMNAGGATVRVDHSRIPE